MVIYIIFLHRSFTIVGIGSPASDQFHDNDQETLNEETVAAIAETGQKEAQEENDNQKRSLEESEQRQRDR